jgi:membrane-associated phospholipid phosphatase
MIAANGLPPNRTAHAALQRCWTNVGMAFALLARPTRFHPPRLWPASLRQFAVAAAAMFVCWLICMVFFDGPVAQAVMRAPRWVIWPFDQITDFGKSGWFLWPLGLLFLALAALPPPLTKVSQAVLAAVMVRVGFLFLAIGVPGLFVSIVKRMIGRARPLATGHIDPFAFAPFIWRADYASLPSGHATTAFSVLVAFGTLWPRGRTVLLLYALAISVSRVMVMAHYPSDVLAGAVVGTVGALMVRHYFALRRLGFSAGPGGELHQFTGPSIRRIKAVAREQLAS